MDWDTAKNTHLKATLLAEAGDIVGAVHAYTRGGAKTYSNKDYRKRRKAELNSVGKRHLAQRGVDARLFYTAYRRFFLPTLNTV